MKKLITICLVFLMSAGLALADFDNSNYTYTKIYDVAAGVRTSEAQFSPDGTKILWGEALSDWSQMSVKFGDWDSATKTISNITTVTTATGGNYAYNAKWSPDGSYIGYIKWDSTWGETAASQIWRYNMSGSSTAAYYVPTAGTDVGNFDFYGNNNSIVFWDGNPNHSNFADLYTYDGTARSQLTNTNTLKEYEPRVFFTDNGQVLYWSGETTGEPYDSIHILNTSDSSVTDVALGTVGHNLYWPVWGKNQDFVGVVDWMGSGNTELLLYENVGGTWQLAEDLTGDGYEGGNWTFFGDFYADGSFCFQSDIGGSGRDIWFAETPEPATIGLLGLGGLALLRKRRK